MGRNVWDTTPEEESEIGVDVVVEISDEEHDIIKRICLLQEQQEEEYMYTRELQIRELRKKVGGLHGT